MAYSPQFGAYSRASAQSVTFHRAGTPDKGNTVIVPVTLNLRDAHRVNAIYIMGRERGIYRVQGVEGDIPPGPYPAPDRRTAGPGQLT